MNDVIPHSAETVVKTERAIALVGEGAMLKDACATVGMHPSTFALVISSLRNLSAAYAHAQTVRADILADEALTIADTDKDAGVARNRILARQWRASKLAPKTYGDRLDIAVTQTISVGDALAEARARLIRPVSDQQVVEDAQVVDSQPVALPTPSDEASQTPDQPDIFS